MTHIRRVRIGYVGRRLSYGDDELAQCLGGRFLVALQRALVVHVAGEELVHRRVPLGMKDLAGGLLQTLPLVDEVVFLALLGEELVIGGVGAPLTAAAIFFLPPPRLSAALYIIYVWTRLAFQPRSSPALCE